MTLRERVDRGDIVVNYGAAGRLPQQGDIVVPVQVPQTTTADGPQPQTPTDVGATMPYGAWSVTPDLWLKVNYKALTLEFETIGIFGKIAHPGTLAANQDAPLTLSQLGWVAAGELRLYRDALFVGLETGGATGDQAEAPGQYLNYRWRFVQQPSGDHSISDFHFSPDYHVDEILFRHILGTVTNAIYIKPQTAYWFDLGTHARARPERQRHLQHGAGPRVDARQRADVRPRDGRRRRLPQHRRRASTPGSPGASCGRWARSTAAPRCGRSRRRTRRSRRSCASTWASSSSRAAPLGRAASSASATRLGGSPYPRVRGAPSRGRVQWFARQLRKPARNRCERLGAEPLLLERLQAFLGVLARGRVLVGAVLQVLLERLARLGVFLSCA